MSQHVTVVIPALNEEQSIGQVVHDLRMLRDASQQVVVHNIIVCDNGSTDSTTIVAAKAGARVVLETRRGYGYACLRALAEIKATDVVVFIDADNAFFANQTMDLLQAINKGADMVIGSRVLGHSDERALTAAQKFGNRLATFLIDHIWEYRYTDLGPFRAIRWACLQKLSMCDTHYGWTVEMQVKAILNNLLIREVPVDTRVRIGKSKISGTVSGTIKAGLGILGMIARLRWQQTCLHKQINSNENYT